MAPAVAAASPRTHIATMSPWAAMVSTARSPHWVNTPVLLQAIERYEQDLLPRSMHLWVRGVLELDQEPGSATLRPHG
jgi:hypothetical protein